MRAHFPSKRTSLILQATQSLGENDADDTYEIRTWNFNWMKFKPRKMRRGKIDRRWCEVQVNSSNSAARRYGLIRKLLTLKHKKNVEKEELDA